MPLYAMQFQIYLSHSNNVLIQHSRGASLVPRLFLFCLHFSLGERPWLRLVM